jgi:hypothetical protein
MTILLAWRKSVEDCEIFRSLGCGDWRREWSLAHGIDSELGMAVA